MEDVAILRNFYVSSPWSDRHSLIAHWSWFSDADLRYFKNAHVYYYSSLDEGFEKGKLINEPVNSYTMNNLRPETVYFVCLRVLRRRQPKFLRLKSPFTSTLSPSIETTKQVPAIQLPWNQRQPLNKVAPDYYAFEVKCSEATTQNWHLTALIGGILGVVFALVLGLLLLFALKHKQWWQTNGKNLPQTSFLNNSFSRKPHSNARKGWSKSSNGGSFRNNMGAHSSSSRGVSEFSGNLREEDEEDEDEAIAEDDEDTEADTVCKSSVRSQAGIYGGSGGTTSSNRHSSVSSIDPRDDVSSVTHCLPVNRHLGNKRGSRKSRQEFRDLKRTTGSGASDDQPKVLISRDSVANVYSGVKVNIVSPSPETGGTKEDLSVAIEIDQPPPPVPRYGERMKIRHSVFDQTSILSLCTPHRMTIAAPLLDKESICTKTKILREQTSAMEKCDSCCDQKCLTPLPLLEPQPVSLTHPILSEKLTPPPNTANASFSEINENFIISPHVGNIKTVHLIDETPFLTENEEDFYNNDWKLKHKEEIEPSLNLSSASMETDSSYEACLGSYFIGTDQSIYAEFIETI